MQDYKKQIKYKRHKSVAILFCIYMMEERITLYDINIWE